MLDKDVYWCSVVICVVYFYNVFNLRKFTSTTGIKSSSSVVNWCENMSAAERGSRRISEGQFHRRCAAIVRRHVARLFALYHQRAA